MGPGSGANLASLPGERILCLPQSGAILRRVSASLRASLMEGVSRG